MMTIDESARRLGELVWTECALFELLGRWVATTPEPAVKVAFSHASRLHGDHAVALAALLPDTRDHDPQALVGPSGDLAGALDAAGRATTTAERLDALHHGLAGGQRRALEAYLGDAAAVRDGPGIRVVAVVLAEDRAGFEGLRRLGVL